MTHRHRKRFAQHFLQDEYIISKIVDVIHPQIDEYLLEIGPGLGVLTTELLPFVKRLDVVEIDRDLVIQLKEELGHYSQLRIWQADILEFALSSVIEKKEKLRIVGNLPYNITSPIIFYLLSSLPLVEDMHFMVQKEVGERLGAVVGTADYGRLSVMTQYYCHIQVLFEVPATAFEPPPRVESVIVRLVPYQSLPYVADDFPTFAFVVKRAFNQRRKTIANTLKELIVAKQLQEIGIDPQWRPQNLTVEHFVKISNWVYNYKTDCAVN